MLPTPAISLTGESHSEMINNFEKILDLNGKKKIAKLTVDRNGVSSDNLGSSTQKITIQFHNTESQPLHLFVKSQTSNNSVYSAFMGESKLFEKEAIFFNRYIPAATEFCKSKGQEHLLDIYPKCFYASNTTIVLEDVVKAKGFSLWTNSPEQDFDTARVALKSLAKHHAISYALLNKLGGADAFFNQFPNLNFEPFTQPADRELMENWIVGAIQININLLETTPVEGSADALSAYRTNSGRVSENLIEALDVSQDDKKFLVLNHGDYWNNNMFFKTKSPTDDFTDHIMVDFQLTRYGNLCLDILYYLFLSVQADVRRLSLHELLNVYLVALNETSRKLGYPMEISIEQIFLNLRKKVHFGVWYSMLSNHGLRFIVAHELDISKLKSMSDFSKQLQELTQKWLEDHPEEREKYARHSVALMKEFTQLLYTD